MSAPKYNTMATIEEALVQTNFGKFNYALIIFSGLILNNVLLESIGISFTLPILECDMNLTYQQQGVLGAVSFIGIIVSSHFWGFLADTIGRKRIMLPALMLAFVVTILSSFSPNFEMLAVMRFFSGILLSACSATVFAYLGEFHCQKYRNRAILSAAFISAFMAIFFPILAWFFINQTWEFYVPIVGIIYKPWRSYMLACGSCGLICGLMLCFLPESPKYLLAMGRTEEAIAVLKQMHKRNMKCQTGSEKSIFQITSLQLDSETRIHTVATGQSKNSLTALLKLMWTQTAPLFMREHIRKTFLAGVIQFLTFFAAHGVYMWFPYILNSVMQYQQKQGETMCLCDFLSITKSVNMTLIEDETIGECSTHLEISTYQHTIMLEVIYVSLLLCVSFTIEKTGRVIMLLIILGISGVCGMASLVVQIPLLAVYLFLIFLCCGLAIVVVNAIVIDIYPTNLRAMAVCIALMFGRIGSVTGSNALGALIGTNCEATLFISSFSLIVAGCLGFLLPHPKTEDKKSNTDC